MPTSKTKPKSASRKKMALGKGLGALIPDIDATGSGSREYFQCDITDIRPNPHQPRVDFSQTELAELSESIRTQGIIQPLLVRPCAEGYELVAGERRLRAARMAGLTQVPVVVKQISDTELLEMSIVENIQRENLNPMEEADAYHQLITRFDLTQDQAAARVGKSRPTVANLLRLRQLPPPIQTGIRDSLISMGHARALLGAENHQQQMAAYRAVTARGLSVRQTERLIKQLRSQATAGPAKAARPHENYFNDLAHELSLKYGTKVEILRKGQKGKLQIEFYSNEDLDRLIQLLSRQ